jgi:hypothetical protein
MERQKRNLAKRWTGEARVRRSRGEAELKLVFNWRELF